MLKRVLLFTTTVASATLFSCNNSGTDKHKDDKDTTQADTTEVVIETPEMYEGEQNGIKVYEVVPGTEFPDAKLTLDQPAENEVLPPDGYRFMFNISNYELAKPTPDESDRHCAASAKGQHIHFILDNQPYSAHYERDIDKKLEVGSHIMLAFLSRSYHESIKNGEAFVLTEINVGEINPNPADLTKPMLFYSRPKGEYTGEDTKKLLLDFYVVNTDLSESGYKVKATIDGNEFILPHWKPYMVEGLAMGEHTFRIVMIDAEGNEMAGTDSGERTITLKEGAAK